MRKITLTFLAIFVSLFLVSCGDEETPKTADKKLSEATPDTLISEILTIPYQYDLSTYIEIEKDDYIGIEIEKADYTVSDDDVNDAIYADLADHATYNDVDRPAEKGDTLTINFTGSIDGIEFDGGAAENYEMVLGQANFIAGFEDALVGHSKGENFVIDVTLPENYGKEELNGKAAQFEIDILSIKEEVLPQFSVEFVKENYNCDTIEAYLSLKQEQLIAAKATEVENNRKSAAFEKIAESVTIKDYPKTNFKNHYNLFVSNYESMASSMGYSLEKLISDMGSTMEEFDEYAQLYAFENIFQELICFSIAKSEGLLEGLKKSDYDAHLAKIAESDGITVTEAEKAYGQEYIVTSLVLDRAMQFVIDNAVEVEPEADDASDATADNEPIVINPTTYTEE